MQCKYAIGHYSNKLMRLTRHIIGLDLASTLHIDKHQSALFIAYELDMRHDCVRLSKPQEQLSLPVVDLVHHDFSDGSFTILHIDKMFSIEVKWDAVLSKLQVLGRMLDKHVLL